jgi:hypothetical protein
MLTKQQQDKAQQKEHQGPTQRSTGGAILLSTVPSRP